MSQSASFLESTHRMDLTGQVLIAMPAMQDPYFAKSVILVCNHDDDGAMGIILNHELELTQNELFEQLQVSCDLPQEQQRSVFFGGPVQVERGFVLHSPATEFNTTLSLSHGLGLTSSKDIIEAAARGEAPSQRFIALGYAGWSAGQLESEIQNNVWLTLAVPVPEQLHMLVFQLASEDKLNWAMQQLGVNFATLSEVAGHA